MLDNPVRVKICFLMDCTASMQPWLKAAATHIHTIIQDLENKYNNADFSVAFIGYRDYGDKEQFIIRNFNSPIKIEYYISQIVAEGGFDEAEDVAWALDKIRTAIDWQPSEIRMVYHIADSPAHGLRYHHETVTDRFPDGDPDGLDPLDPLVWLSDNRMYYNFIRITNKTDKMINIFSHIYEPSRFNIIDLSSQGPSGFRQQLTESLNQTLTQNISSPDLELD